ncbi:MAG: NmrA/HSCARG family protein [Bryobacteraceae bacterium]|jgi:uncharacterized protein YbjT (DUF2867 family)
MSGKTILVTGATGSQGGGVATHLLSSGRYAVRCLTRKPQSDRAAALRRAGAEVVQGDFEDVPSLKAAMQGCYGVFGVTNYWEAFEREYPQGKNLVDAVAASGIEHFIFSSLPSVTKLTHGQLDVPHVEIKARIEEYSRGLGLPATYVHVAFYYENFLTYFPPRRLEDGSFVFAFPQGDAPLAAVAVEDTGGVVAALFDRGAETMGRVVGVAGDEEPCQAYAATMSRVTGQRIAYQHVPREAFAALGFPGAEDLANMFEFFRRFVPSRRAEIEESRMLYPGMRSFETWLVENRERFRGVLSANSGAGAA